MYGLRDFYCMWHSLSSSGSFQAVREGHSVWSRTSACSPAVQLRSSSNPGSTHLPTWKMDNQKHKGGSAVCLEKIPGVLKRFPFLRWGKFCDHSSHCPAALWLEAPSCHKLRNGRFISCGYTYPSKYCLPGSRKWHVGGSISDYTNQKISSGKHMFMYGGCYADWGASTSNYFSRLVRKAFISQTWELHPR